MPRPVSPPRDTAPNSAPSGATAKTLLAWYDRHARSLPWRVSPQDRAEGVAPDPYRVWLSEVMLQQTTVAAVKTYFARFTARWPTVEDLAAAPEDEILGEWAGLGYYARARNLFACARTVANAHAGAFPRTAERLKALPGIGDYTSAAIAAIAFDEPVAVVDGNVERVITRLYAIETPLPAARKTIREKMAAITPRKRPGDFAQGMMDLGATVCTPKSPNCMLCPLREGCRAAAEGRQGEFPVKAPKRGAPERQGAAFVAVRALDGAVFLRKRPDKGMLGGMSEAPSTDWSARANGATGLASAPFPANWRFAGTIEHGFTHFRIVLEVYVATIATDPPLAGWWSTSERRTAEALPTLMTKVLTRALANHDHRSARQSQ